MPLHFCLAEREGFEPSRAFRALHDFQSCALDQLSHLSIAARQNRTARVIIASAARDVKPFLPPSHKKLVPAPGKDQWRTKPPNSEESVRFMAKALARSAAYNSAMVAW